MRNEKFICPDAPKKCRSGYCYHKHPHHHIEDCDSGGAICGNQCVPYKEKVKT